MSRRKSEIAAYMNERDFPHLVELELPAGGFRDKSQELESFHRERGIAIRRGRGRHEAEQFHVRFQTLLAQRSWEMQPDERTEWEQIEREGSAGAGMQER